MSDNGAPSGVVWILGAGFSKFLGGPLLTELFTAEGSARVRRVYKGQLEGPDVEDIFNPLPLTDDLHGFDFPVRPRPWLDAEDFLEKFDRASQIESAAIALGFGQEVAKQIHASALHYLAAETSLFLLDSDVAEERWSPYVTWAEDLGSTDTVITFNYDLIPDLVEDFYLERTGKSRLWIPPIGQEFSQGLPIVIKMHGCVSWYWDEKGDGDDEEAKEAKRTTNFRSVLEKPHKRPIIASPGLTKHKLIKSGDFAPMWDYAASAIKNAEALVFCGYRMPPTDAGTKQWFVKALRAWLKTHTSDLRIHIVLGPDPNSEHAARLQGLLRSIDERLKPHVLTMGAEDFLGLLNRDQLLGDEAAKRWMRAWGSAKE